MPAKQSLRDELLRVLENNLATLERAHQASREGATHEEAKPENDKDTRALEQSYLARGQAMRVEEVRTAVAEVRVMPLRPPQPGQAVALGTVVSVLEDGDRLVFFLAPHGGGALLAEGTVQVVTPKSPLGRGLLGKRAGDECEIRLADRTREFEVLAVE